MPEVVEAAFGLAARLGGPELLGGLQVSTPNEHVDRMVNIWNPYQCMVTFNLSRSASLFESGIGRGMGFRDSQPGPARVRAHGSRRGRAQRILDIAATQLPTGGAYHQYQPLTKRGNDAVGSGFNDDPLWLVLAVAAYLKETGDRGDPRRAGAVRQRSPGASRRCTSTSSARCSTRSTGSGRTGCR